MKKLQRYGRTGGKSSRLETLPDMRLNCYGFCSRICCPLKWRAVAEGSHLPEQGAPEDCLSIPAVARGRDISSLNLSVRLRNVLGWKGCRVLGDLQGMHLSELRQWRNCGKVTALELLGLVCCLQHASWRPQIMPEADGIADGWEI
jgi:hypothetical protein